MTGLDTAIRSGELPELEVAWPTRLRRSVSWPSSALLAVGAAFQVTVVLGGMAGELGNVQILVWSGAAAIGLVQCFMIAELATHAPDRAGGVATYPQEAFGRRAPWLAALSGWGYWFAWTPGIPLRHGPRRVYRPYGGGDGGPGGTQHRLARSGHAAPYHASGAKGGDVAVGITSWPWPRSQMSSAECTPSMTPIA